MRTCQHFQPHCIAPQDQSSSYPHGWSQGAPSGPPGGSFLRTCQHFQPHLHRSAGPAQRLPPAHRPALPTTPASPRWTSAAATSTAALKEPQAARQEAPSFSSASTSNHTCIAPLDQRSSYQHGWSQGAPSGPPCNGTYPSCYTWFGTRFVDRRASHARPDAGSILPGHKWWFPNAMCGRRSSRGTETLVGIDSFARCDRGRPLSGEGGEL